jgi:hypothetical protein
MTIELYRTDGESFQLEYFGIWEKLLALAHIYGWQPAGTDQPLMWQDDADTGRWSGGYDHYLGEQVRDEDAQALADALERALPDLPDVTMPDRVFETEMEEIDREGQISISYYIIEPNTALNLFEVFGGQYKQELMAFINFCRQGGFQIHTLGGFSS